MQKELEWLASEFHNVYQQEAKKQGDVRHKDNYYDLPENIKDFDRALVQYLIKMLTAYTVHLMNSNEKARKMFETATKEQVSEYCEKQLTKFLETRIMSEDYK